jgi:hypothetical protein
MIRYTSSALAFVLIDMSRRHYPGSLQTLGRRRDQIEPMALQASQPADHVLGGPERNAQ